MLARHKNKLNPERWLKGLDHRLMIEIYDAENGFVVHFEDSDGIQDFVAHTREELRGIVYTVINNEIR